MLPVYRATSLISIFKVGGRTKPWLVIVDDNGTPKPYVVKLFSFNEIEANNCVTKEVLGNLLAQELGLPVPKAALIDMDGSFLSTLQSQEAYECLEAQDERLKFGTELINNVIPFVHDIFTPAEARAIIDIDSVLAFDVLIRNIDRSKRNPNLLLKDQKGFLIDHEVAFQIDENSKSEFLNWQLPEKYIKEHLFYSLLLRSPRQYKEEYFNEFEELLKRLNINMLNPHLAQLQRYGFPQNKLKLWIDYLYAAKQNSSIFVNSIKGRI